MTGGQRTSKKQANSKEAQITSRPGNQKEGRKPDNTQGDYWREPCRKEKGNEGGNRDSDS